MKKENLHCIIRVFHYIHYKLDIINQVSNSGLKTAISGFCLEKNYDSYYNYHHLHWGNALEKLLKISLRWIESSELNSWY